MKRQKFPYWEWEDYQAGLYGLNWNGTIADAVDVLSSPVNLERLMSDAVTRWPKAAAHHLTDGGMNQRAWLGWAACGLAAQVPAHMTRAAWWRLSEQQRQLANDAADRVITLYAEAGKLSLFQDHA